ncbi:MAG: sulfur carrier protein ThiS [Chlorobiales bacterium]|nr:sulfur carrier protein ThiS [Chlorobiales bacterium]
MVFVMITITLNGEQRKIRDGSTVDDILDIIGTEQQRVAVVVNENIVPPENRSSMILRKNDQVDVLAFAEGG